MEAIVTLRRRPSELGGAVWLSARSLQVASLLMQPRHRHLVISGALVMLLVIVIVAAVR
ncbi:MAG: hypothetical protein H0T14_00270 [Nocardioidaceae bacterium]|nr:hypothetical protein [Nocardioidaceae bacterium]